MLLLPFSSPAAAAAAQKHLPAAAAAAAAVPKAPPGTKTARHGRTNRPQNRTEKVPNVTSAADERELMRDTRGLLLLLLLNRRVARAPPGTKTARHGRTNRP